MRRSGIGWIPLLIGISLASSAFADGAKVVHLKPDAQISDWAFDTNSNRVFAVATRGEVQELDSSQGKVLRRIKIPKNPQRAWIKSGVLAVCHKGGVLTLVDLKKNRVLRQLYLDNTGPFLFFSSKTKTPWIYVLASNTNKAKTRHRPTIVQVDLGRNAITHTQVLNTQTWHRGGALSPDGKWLVLGGQRKMWQFTVREGGKSTFRSIGHPTYAPHSPFHAFTYITKTRVGRPGRSWVFGNYLYSWDLSKRLRTFGQSPLLLHPTLDLAFSLTNPRSSGALLGLYRCSSGKRVREIVLSKEAVPSARWSPVRFDLATKGGRVFVGFRQFGRVIVLPPDTVDPKRHRLIELIAPTWRNLNPGTPFSLTLRVRNPPPGVRFSLLSGPKGLTLKGPVLTWTPEIDDLGSHAVRVEAIAGASRAQATIRLDVSMPSVHLGRGFRARALWVDPLGKRALVAGSHMIRQVPLPGCRLVLVDLVGKKVLAQRQMSKWVGTAFVDTSTVLVSSQYENQLYSLDPKTLQSRRRLFFEGSIRRIFPLPQKGSLAVETMIGVWTLADRTLNTRSLLFRFGPHPALNRGVHVLPQGLLVGPRVVDKQTGKVLMIAGQLPGIPYAGTARPFLKPETSDRYSVPTPWNRYLDGKILRKPYSSGHVAILPTLYCRILAEVPLVALQAVSRNAVHVEFRDVVTGVLVRSNFLSKPKPERGRWSGPAVPLRGAPGRLAAAYVDRLFLVDYPKSPRVEPVRFVHRLRPHRIPHDRVVSAAVRAKGGKGQLKFRLLGSVEGVTLAPSGVLRIDAPRIWRSFLERTRRVAQAAHAAKRPVRSYGEGYVQRMRGTFKATFGVATKSFVISLSVPLQAYDVDGRTAELNPRLLILGPEREIRAAQRRSPGPKEVSEKKRLRLLRQHEMALSKLKVEINRISDHLGRLAGMATKTNLKDVQSRVKRLDTALSQLHDSKAFKALDSQVGAVGMRAGRLEDQVRRLEKDRAGLAARVKILESRVKAGEVLEAELKAQKEADDRYATRTELLLGLLLVLCAFVILRKGKPQFHNPAAPGVDPSDPSGDQAND